MTVTVNGRTPATESDIRSDVHVRVRGPKIPRQASDCGDPDPGSTCTYAISRLARIRQLFDARDFVSLNVTELVAEGASGWLPSEQPQPLWVTLRQVIPRRDEVSGWLSWTGASAAGLVRASVHTLAYLFIFATATRRRAAVFGVVCLLLAGVYTAGRLVG
jgi:hypothetical protein